MHFNRGWVPYDEREAYLLESDIGVCAHHDHLEARFSFRTRVLDHFWAGLPSVVSSGDAIGDLVDRRGLGRAVAPGRRRGLRAACAELLDDRDGLRRRGAGACASWRRRCAGARSPGRSCASAASGTRGRARPPARSALARATYGQYPDILADLRDRGGLRRSPGACRSTWRACCATGTVPEPRRASRVDARRASLRRCCGRAAAAALGPVDRSGGGSTPTTRA